MITISPTYLFIWKNELMVISARPSGVFSLTPGYPCKSHYRELQWADLVID